MVLQSEVVFFFCLFYSAGVQPDTTQPHQMAASYRPSAGCRGMGVKTRAQEEGLCSVLLWHSASKVTHGFSVCLKQQRPATSIVFWATLSTPLLLANIQEMFCPSGETGPNSPSGFSLPLCLHTIIAPASIITTPPHWPTSKHAFVLQNWTMQTHTGDAGQPQSSKSWMGKRPCLLTGALKSLLGAQTDRDEQGIHQ